MKSIVSEKGQVTIPKALRDSLALLLGTELEFSEENGALVARRITRNSFQGLIGLIPHHDIDGRIVEMRGPAWNPESDAPS